MVYMYMYVRVEYKEQQSKVSFKIWHSILIMMNKKRRYSILK